jgi:hypothetical protein
MPSLRDWGNTLFEIVEPRSGDMFVVTTLAIDFEPRSGGMLSI